MSYLPGKEESRRMATASAFAEPLSLSSILYLSSIGVYIKLREETQFGIRSIEDIMSSSRSPRLRIHVSFCTRMNSGLADPWQPPEAGVSRPSSLNAPAMAFGAQCFQLAGTGDEPVLSRSTDSCPWRFSGLQAMSPRKYCQRPCNRQIICSCR